MKRFAMRVAAVVVVVVAAGWGRAADAPAAAPGGGWVNVSDPVIKKLEGEGKKIDWPGLTAGVICDATNGDVYMVVPGQGLWKSSDRGGTFARVDGGAISGRCET